MRYHSLTAEIRERQNAPLSLLQERRGVTCDCGEGVRADLLSDPVTIPRRVHKIPLKLLSQSIRDAVDDEVEMSEMFSQSGEYRFDLFVIRDIAREHQRIVQGRGKLA